MDFEEWHKASKWGGETWTNCISTNWGCDYKQIVDQQMEGVNVEQIANQ